MEFAEARKRFSEQAEVAQSEKEKLSEENEVISCWVTSK